MKQEKITVRIEKTKTGYSAYYSTKVDGEKAVIASTGKTLEHLFVRLARATRLAFEDDPNDSPGFEDVFGIWKNKRVKR